MLDFDYLRSEYVKCFTDESRIYMITHYLKTYDGTQGKEVPFELFPRQQLLCKTLSQKKPCVTEKYRQAGITTTVAAFISCQIVLSDKSKPLTTLCIGNTLDLAQQMLFKIRDFLLQFPLWMWGDEFKDKGYDLTQPPPNQNLIFEVCNGKEVKLRNFKDIGQSRIVARSSGENASRGVGGVHYLIFDEFAFLENAKSTYGACIPTISTTKGQPIIVSTPNGSGGEYYEICRRAKMKGSVEWNGFELVDMKWYQDPRYNRFLEWTKKNDKTGEVEVFSEPTLNKEGNVKYDEEHWQKMVEDGWKPRSPWYLHMCRQFNFDEQKIAQELDVSFIGSAANVVNPEYIEQQKRLNVCEPLFRDQLEEDTWIWKEPIEGHRYILAIDNSRGDSEDRTAIEVIDVDAVDEDGMPCFEQVLEYNGKRTGDEIGAMAFNYGMAYGQAFIVVEDIGGQGTATILTLQNMEYPNLYYDDPNLKAVTMEREATTLKKNKEGKLPGFHSSNVRYQMLSSFANMVRTNTFKVRSKRTANELDTWVFKNGRMDHMDGAHDDTITCLAMGMFVFQFSVNKMQEAKERDKAMLKGMICTANAISEDKKVEVSMQIKMTNNDLAKAYDPFDLMGMVNKVQKKNKTGVFSDPKKAACMWVVV